MRGQASFVVVMCQQLGLRENGFGELGFECLGDALMVLLAGAFQQRLVGRVLDQGMFEAVGCRWRLPLLV